MEKIYRIGSFNLRNIGKSAFSDQRDLEKIATIIRNEKLDVVALQEVLTEGKIFTKDDLPSSITKKSILSYLGGPEHWGFEWAFSGDESLRHEGYAFLWNKDRLDLSTAEVVRNGTKFTRVYRPRMIKVNHRDMKRYPFYARFTPQGKAGGSSFEIRMICVHTYYGDDKLVDRIIRQNELDVLMKEIYPKVADENFQNSLPRYTILLGDYNAELVTSENKLAVAQRNIQRRNIPMVMKTDENGMVFSDKYGIFVKTTQDQLTTLKRKIQDGDEESFEDRGYASNYDHFSYDQDAIGHVVKKKPRRIKAVQLYCNDDYEKYYKEISDHIPIVMELQIN